MNWYPGVNGSTTTIEVKKDSPSDFISSVTTASLHKLAAGHKLATTHLNVSNRQMCGCTGFKSGSYNKSYYNRPFKNDTGL